MRKIYQSSRLKIKILLGNKLIYTFSIRFQLHERAYERGMDATLLLCGMTLGV